MPGLRIALAQINTTVGDFEGNRALIGDALDAARKQGADLVTFPELTVCGYPPEDLVLKPRFVQENRRSLEAVLPKTHGLTAVVGYVAADDAGIYNAAAMLHDGKFVGEYRKILLPNYGVFDELRYFLKGQRCPVFTVRGAGLGLTVCEDMWLPGGPARQMAEHGADIIINISASPYHSGKQREREEMFGERARECGRPVVFTNLVGGQDELVFDGGSLVLDAGGAVAARGASFAADLVLADVGTGMRAKNPGTPGLPLMAAVRHCRPERIIVSPATRGNTTAQKPKLTARRVTPPSPPGEVYQALTLGTSDYVTKNSFSGVLIGLSGGIDSSLVATLAADALGPDAVTGVAMPSRYSSVESLSDAEKLADNLGLKLLTLPIEPIFKTYLEALAETFTGAPPDVTEENLQARIRGNLLMALSNKFGSLVLTTGNKSEMATGYCTLYGDMAGGFAVIKDVPKTMVYDLCRYRNQISPVIPESVLQKPPTAELRPEQRDSDSLPPYGVLDPVLERYVELDQSVDDIIRSGVSAEVVNRAARLVDISEYKRRQAPPGVRITARAFGRDRRLPITNRYRGG